MVFVKFLFLQENPNLWNTFRVWVPYFGFGKALWLSWYLLILSYCHIVGCMKRLLKLWLVKGPVHVRLVGGVVNEISSRLLSIAPQLPEWFARKCRALKVMMRYFNWGWKKLTFNTYIIILSKIPLKTIFI